MDNLEQESIHKSPIFSGKDVIINKLPEYLINQIKAGEIVERPALLLKELIENSIDAKASRIEIEIKNNGIDLIRIKDNGHGISYNNLELAFSRHATSKIKNYNDLFNLYSFGFRGEALASISSISKVHCITSTKEETSQIKIEGSKILQKDKIEKTSNESFTEIFISNLFYNTPVRLKFIGNILSEKNKFKHIINAFIIMYPQIEWLISFDQNTKTVFVPKDRQSRIQKLILNKRNNIVNCLKKEFQNYRLEFYYSPNDLKSANYTNQFIFVNNRLVESKKIHNSLVRALTPSIWQGKAAGYCLCLFLNPSEIDVNVHPNKKEIKFIKEGNILSFIYNGIRSQIDEMMVTNSSIPTLTKANLENNHIQSKNIDQHLINSKTYENFILLQKTNEFLSFYFENRTYILSIKKFLNEFLPSILNHAKQSEKIPYLISREIQNNLYLTEMIEFCNELGFEIESVKKEEKETYFLRTYPYYLSFFIPEDFFNFLIDNYENLRENNFNHLNEANLFNRVNLENFISFFNLQKLQSTNCIIKLEEQISNKLFKYLFKENEEK